MISNNIKDAKKECLENPNCYMFYDAGGRGSLFRACKVTAAIEGPSSGSILYRKLGDKKYSLILKIYCIDNFSILDMWLYIIS